jgi:hypothetical protein
MRALPLAALVAALAGCVVVPARRYPPPPPPPAAPPPAPVPPPAPAPRAISQQQAVDIAFRLAHERGLAVDRVKHVHLDGRGRWHVELRGHRDRARVLLDARDGRLLRGAFKDDEKWDDD